MLWATVRGFHNEGICRRGNCRRWTGFCSQLCRCNTIRDDHMGRNPRLRNRRQSFGGASYASLSNDTYTVALSFDPTALTGDTCGSSTSINYCNWVFGASGVTEVVTVNGHAKTYTSAGPGGSLGIGVSSDAINLSIGGVPQFGLYITDGSSLFASTSNANNPEFNFSNISVSGNFGDSNLGGSSGASLGGSVTKLSASFTSGGSDPVRVPEPVTVSLFGAGLAGVAAIRRRKKKIA